MNYFGFATTRRMVTRSLVGLASNSSRPVAMAVLRSHERTCRPTADVPSRTSGAAMCRLCCKSLKTPGDKFPARSRNKPRSLIDVASGSLPKSPVSLSPGDEVPRMFTRKPRLQLEKFAINGAKRLLQHNLPKPAVSRCSKLSKRTSCYSITSSESASSFAGTSRPSVLAVLRLIIS